MKPASADEWLMQLVLGCKEAANITLAVKNFTEPTKHCCSFQALGQQVMPTFEASGHVADTSPTERRSRRFFGQGVLCRPNWSTQWRVVLEGVLLRVQRSCPAERLLHLVNVDVNRPACST